MFLSSNCNIVIARKLQSWENGCIYVRLQSAWVSRTWTLPSPLKSCPEEFKGLISLSRTSKCLTAGSVFLHMSQGGSMMCRNLRHTHWHVQTVGTAIGYWSNILCTTPMAYYTYMANLRGQPYSRSSRHTWLCEMNPATHLHPCKQSLAVSDSVTVLC